MQVSARLSLPLLSPGQAQKELFHNEALQVLDSIVAPAAEDGPLGEPPESPAVGSCYLVGDSATGAWAGQGNRLAAMTDGGWRFISPVEGMAVWLASRSLFAIYVAGAWEIGSVRSSRLLVDGQQVVGPQSAAIDEPEGGATADSEARAAIGAILSALRSHGLIAAT